MNYERLGILAVLLTFLVACDQKSSAPTADQIDQKKQERMDAEAARQVDLPNIVNFTARRTMKMLYEGMDKARPTYSYNYNPFKGCYVPFGGSGITFGYPLPYATQMTNPQKLVSNDRYNGAELITMNNADPDGLFKPASASATVVLMMNPDTKQLEPQYSEPDLVTFTFKPSNICPATEASK